MDNHREYVHERINPDIEQDYDRLIDSLAIIESPSSEDARQRNEQMLSNDEAEPVKPLPMTQASNIDHQDPRMSISTQSKHLVGLPFELVDYILSFLGPIDLVAVSSTCKFFAAHAKSELAWQRHVQDNIPGVSLTSPYPCKTYRELYISHDPHWFLPKYKVWFCDYFLTGKLIITRYDPRKGSIEGFRLVAERPNPTFVPWEYDDQVLIHEFEPQCRLHMDQPVLQLDAVSQESLMDASEQTSAAQRFRAEIPMRITERSHRGVFSNFILTRPVEERPSNMQLWPPSIVPARHRVHNASQEALVTAGHKPQTRSQVSNQAFRIRRWIEMPSGSSSPGLHLGEEVCTYATLDPKLYTPTEDKPYRGIWVGDYSGHGCEFLLMHQPDDEVPFDEASVVQAEDESVEEWSARKKEERTYRGSLEAIKLTGDPNVPRGEYTFISDDISKAGFIRTATEERFKGARIVKSRGHIAARMFRNDKYIESQLIMISHDRLAQYWAGFGHISFYHRVNIDDFLSPSHDPPLAPIAV